MTYRDILGQENIVSHLKAAVAQKKTSHAYIFCGEDGSGKRMMAERFARALVCESGSGEACGECKACRESMSGNHPDIKYVTHAKPRIISVDEIRDQLNNDMVIKPYNGGKKVYIIDEAEKLNEQAQNAMLKTIEEPPEYGIVVLLVNNAGALLPTIKSRCIQLNFKPVSKRIVKDMLVRDHGISEYMADVAASFADGVPGRAISFAESQAFSEMKSDVVSMLRRVDKMDAGDIYQTVKAWNEGKSKDNLKEKLQLITLWYRDVLVAKSTGAGTKLTFSDEENEIMAQAEKYSYKNLMTKVEETQKARDRIAVSVNADATIMVLLFKLREK